MIVLDIGRDIQMDLTITNLTKKFDNFTAVDNINVTMTTLLKMCFCIISAKRQV